ncbi:hypothetical protein [Synechococcus sp. PCC 7336]|uniref:hypothetical protein n=1 Tax=Synechococcus sp. PCC 7336 TaxID=195250 RepID=UPI00034CCE77|nr:hypothetical protein [Synechococcus sp. PCC 7336]
MREELGPGKPDMTPEIREELDRLERIASLNLQTSTNNLEAIAKQDGQIGQLREAQQQSQRQIDLLTESIGQLKRAVDYLLSQD